MNGIPKTGYLNSIGFDFGIIYIYAEEGYEVKILRNGVDVTEHLGERGVYDGIECPYIQLDVPAPVDGQATWVITVSRKQTDAGSTANVGDVNQDGNITIADVTLLVDIVLGKAVAPGPISNVALDYDVTSNSSDIKNEVAEKQPLGGTRLSPCPYLRKKTLQTYTFIFK